MRLTVNAPRWFRFRLLAWGARKLGWSRRWEASGRFECDLLTDLQRLGMEIGFTVELTDRGTFALKFGDEQDYVVEASA